MTTPILILSYAESNCKGPGSDDGTPPTDWTVMFLNTQGRLLADPKI
jgi:hypothetical protein